MTEETIKALAVEKLKNHYLGIDDYGMLYMSWDGLKEHHAPLVNAFTAAMCEMYKAALSGTEPFNGGEDEYVEKVKKIMEANETGAIEAVVDEVIMPMKAAIRQYWQMVQTKHEELRKLKAGTERVECYLPCGFSESEIYAGTEAGPLPLKLVTLTVVPNHQS